MIYAYCLSIFSIHFFAKHNISKFKLRLINQQTGDCTDSMILDASKLTADSFPVAIKLKGGQRLLMKVKLVSLAAKSGEMLVGQGVVNFDKSSIDSTLRVPIYDKQQGVEEVAICSIDFFLSGFQVEKHVSINVDKSRSKFQDWRQRTEDAVYSQMSYTVESQEGQMKIQVDSKPTIYTQKKEEIKDKSSREKQKQKNTDKQGKYQQQTPKSSENIPHFGLKKNVLIQSLQKQSQNSQDANRPFLLQNSAYLGSKKKKNLDQKDASQNYMPKSNKKQAGQASKRSNKYNKFAFDSISDDFEKAKQDSSIISPKQIKQKVKQNELMITKLKKYIQSIENNEGVSSQKQHNNKKRRQNIKVQQYAAYNYQNQFVKYYQDSKLKPNKIMRNIKVIRTIQNQIKQDQEGKIIPQLINKLFITSIKNDKLISFDALGFRSHCIVNNQSQSTISIQIPSQENALKAIVSLNEEGNFQGTFGLQEGEKMNIKLNRVDSDGHESILQRSQFKLIFDLRAEYTQKKSAKLINMNNDGSFREPYDILMPEQDIKKRVELLSCQPWAFASYANQINLSPQSKKIIHQINKKLPPQNEHSKLWNLKANDFNQENKKNQGIQFPEKTVEEVKRSKTNYSQQQIIVPKSSKTKQFLQNTPIKVKKLKPIATSSQNDEIYQINNIRNGNRNNYKFKDRASKQIKQAWQQILFKRKIQKEKLDRKKDISRINIGNSTNKKKKKLFDALNTQSLQNSDSQSLSSNKFQAPRKLNKLYEYSQSDDKKSTYPMRCLRLDVSNISITQPQAAIDDKQQDFVGKFVKLCIKDKVMYFTQVIFNEGYNSILWKLQGCIFQELTGSQKLQIQIYQTINNRIKMIGKSQIRISRLFFLRNNHIYNGRIIYNNISNGEFTISFQIKQSFPFEVIQEENQETFNLKKNHSQNKNQLRDRKQTNSLGHHSQKYINKTLKRKELQSTLKRNNNEMRYEQNVSKFEDQLEQSMSLPIGLNRQ